MWDFFFQHSRHVRVASLLALDCSKAEFHEDSDDPDWHLGENFVSASEDN